MGREAEVWHADPGTISHLPEVIPAAKHRPWTFIIETASIVVLVLALLAVGGVAWHENAQLKDTRTAYALQADKLMASNVALDAARSRADTAEASLTDTQASLGQAEDTISHGQRCVHGMATAFQMYLRSIFLAPAAVAQLRNVKPDCTMLSTYSSVTTGFGV